MESQKHLTRALLLPELILDYSVQLNPYARLLIAHKDKQGAVCPKCASLSLVLYDKRTVKIKDTPIHGKGIYLEIKKHRYFCKPCKRPFTEPIPGVLPRRRTTQRYRSNVYWACENFTDLKRVCRAYRCSPGFVYKAYYEQLELRRKKHHQYSFSSWIGIDEHVFGKKKALGKREFITMLVDHNNRKLREVALGKSQSDLFDSFKNIPGRENVKLVTLDMSDTYKSFVKSFFPNAEMVADRFHVQRLIHPALHQARIEITGDKRKNPVRVLMNKNRINLKPWERSALDSWLRVNPDMNEVYQFKEAISRFYRIRGLRRAELAFNNLLDELARSKNKTLHTLRRTLMRWKTEILNFFKYRITNARVEGFNNVAKVIKRRAYGFRSFKNYRLRLLNACS